MPPTRTLLSISSSESFRNEKAVEEITKSLKSQVSAAKLPQDNASSRNDMTIYSDSFANEKIHNLAPVELIPADRIDEIAYSPLLDNLELLFHRIILS